MGGETAIQDVGTPNDMQYLNGEHANKTYDQLSGGANDMYSRMQDAADLSNLDPNAYMNQFLAQAGGLSNMVSGQMSPLQQSLNGIAARESALGGEAALAALGGARNSGAAMASFGQAYADPFARAQAQLQSQQLDLTGDLWNNAMGLDSQNQIAAAQMQNQLAQMYGSNYANLMGSQAQLAADQSAWYTPTYQAQESGWDWGTALTGAGTGAATGAAAGSLFGPGGTGVGAGIGGLLGFFGSGMGGGQIKK